MTFYWRICSIFLVAIGVLLAVLKIVSKTTTGVYRGTEKLVGKTVVITGGNSGIGLESAKDFAKRGARVVMVCRDMEKGDRAKQEIIFETGNSNISTVHIDFASLSSVKKCAANILENEPRIDVLLNNAGTFWEGLRNTEDGLEFLMQSNYFGPFLFTRLLLDRVKKCAPSRIVNVSSVGHKFEKLNTKRLDMARSQIQIYCNAAFCTILFTNKLANSLRGTGVTVNSLHPGFVNTNLVRKAPAWMRFVWHMILSSIFKSAVEGAQTSIYLCVSPDVQNVTGEYFADCKRENVPERAKDEEMSRRLWILSEEAVKLRLPGILNLRV